MTRKPMKQLIDEETDASQKTSDQPPSDRAVRKGETRSVVYSIRLTPEQTEQIQRIGDEAGMPASGLVRAWVVQGLASERENTSVDALVDALSQDVDRLRRQLARRKAS